MSTMVHTGNLRSAAQGLYMRLLLVSILSLMGMAAHAQDSVSIALDKPICLESDTSVPITATVQRTGGALDLPVTVELSGTATLDADYSVAGLSSFSCFGIRILTGGSYGGVPAVTIAAPTTGTQATATAQMGIGAVTVTAGGLYTASPTLAVLPTSGTQVASLLPDLAYSTIVSVSTATTAAIGNYTNLTGTAPAASGGVAAVGNINVVAGGSTNSATLTITTPGFGYAIGESVSFTLTDAAGISLTITGKAAHVISRVRIASSGTGYTGSETLSVTRDTLRDTLAAPNATMTKSLAVVGMTMTNNGSGYTANPAVTFTGGSPTVAATAEVSSIRAQVTIPNGSRSASFTMVPINDNVIELAETIQIEVIPDLVPSPTYVTGRPSSVSATIADDDMTIGWRTIDASAEEALDLAQPEESTYEYAISRSPAQGALPQTTNDPLLFNRDVKLQVVGGTAQLGIDYAFTYMYRHDGQPVGQTMQQIRTSTWDLKRGWQIPTGASAKKGSTVVPYVSGVGTLSVGDIIQFGTDKLFLYQVTTLNATFITVNPALASDYGEGTLIRNNLDTVIAADGGIQGNTIPAPIAVSSTRTITYTTIDFTITPLYDSAPEGAETVDMKLMSSNDYLIADPQVEEGSIGDDDLIVDIAWTANAARPSVPGGIGTIGTATVTLSSPVAKDITVPYLVTVPPTAGAAAPGTDYDTLPGFITIPKGTTSAGIQINPHAGSVGLQTVKITLLDSPDYVMAGSASGAANPAAAVNILDQVGTVSVTATDSVATESETVGTDPGNFRFSIVRITNDPIAITYTVSGSATPGSDYATLPLVATIPAGVSFVDVPLNVVDDQIVESTEDVTVTIQSAAGYSVDPLHATATVQIRDDEPIISIAASGNMSEPATGCTITVSYPGTALNRSITVPYTIAGTATQGVDYAGLSGSAVIPAGSNSTAFPISVLDDQVAEGTETIVITLKSGSAYSLDAVANTVTVQLADDEPFIVLDSVVNGAEPATSAQFTVRMADSLGNPRLTTLSYPVVVSYKLTDGTATGGSDYILPAASGLGQVTIPAGILSAVVQIPVIDDLTPEGDETFTATLQPTTTYNLPSLATLTSATITILDNESTLIVETVSDASEPATMGVFRIRNRGGPVASNVHVRYSIAGTARAGTNYTPLTGTATIPLGASEILIPVVPVDNTIADGTRTVIVTLRPSSEYIVSSQDVATVSILDDDTSAPPPSPASSESGGGTCGAGSGIALLLTLGGWLGVSLRRRRPV